MNEEYIPESGKGMAFLREAFDWLESGLVAVLCVILLFTFVGRTVGVDGQSMYPTLHNKDRLITTGLYGEIAAGDIVVIVKPNFRNEPLIKRVIATGGQTVDIDRETGAVLVDGERLSENYINEAIRPDSEFEMPFPQLVPPGHIFVLGDNRNHSWDSRSLEVGMIDERYVLGKTIYRVLPYDRFGVPA